MVVFVGAKASAEELGRNLGIFLRNQTQPQAQAQQQFVTSSSASVSSPDAVECLHGDKDQSERAMIMRRFKSGQTTVLVATDVAAR